MVTINDQGNTGTGGGRDISQRLTITINEINDAPDISSDATLPSINEEQTDSAGTQISSLLSSLPTPITDRDVKNARNIASDIVGIAIVGDAAAATDGRWEYLPSTSQTWSPIGSVSQTSALILDRNTRIRFVPVTNFSGDPGKLSQVDPPR